MASNTANQITIVTALQTLITTIETDISNWRSGDPYIDKVTRDLLTTRLDLMIGNLLDNGSRAQANTAAAARAKANGGLAQSVDPQYGLLDAYMTHITSHLAVLNAPTSVGRRVHTAGQ